MRYKVIYLSPDNREKLEREFWDFNEAVNFVAEHGPERATLWEAVGFDDTESDGAWRVRIFD
jgi:hypothetical protein